MQTIYGFSKTNTWILRSFDSVSTRQTSEQVAFKSGFDNLLEYFLPSTLAQIISVLPKNFKNFCNLRGGGCSHPRPPARTPMHWNCVCLCYLREMPPLYMCTCNTALTDRFSSINDTLTCEIPVLLCTSDQKLRVLIYYILMSIAWFMITLHSQGFHCLSSETAKEDDTKIKRMSVFFSCTLITFLLLSFLYFFSFASLGGRLQELWNCQSAYGWFGANYWHGFHEISHIYNFTKTDIIWKKHMMI